MTDMPPPASDVAIHREDPARAAILEAARGTAQTDLGKPVRFVVKQMKHEGDWVFLRAAMQGLHGRPIDFADSRLSDAAAHGVVSDQYVGLLKRAGHGWTVIVHATGPTDAVWETWASEYGAPPTLFER